MTGGMDRVCMTITATATSMVTKTTTTTATSMTTASTTTVCVWQVVWIECVSLMMRKTLSAVQ